MPCYIQKTKPATKAEFKLWQELGYTGTWEHFCESRKSTEGQPFFICGDLGEHCADCSAIGDFLCDFPVGEGKTCDRPVCEEHCKEIGPELHYCETHYRMWCDFKDSGGIDAALRNVIAFKSEK